MTQEEFETMANKIGEVAPDQLPNFMSNPDNFDYNVLEGYSAFTDKYKNVANFLGDKNAIKAQIWNDLNGKFPSEPRFQSLKNEYPWLNKEDLKDWFDKTNEYKKFYEDEARKEGEKNLRKQEVKEWGFLQNLLASDYSKQRYIDDPNASLFGKQGKFNPYTSQGQEELRDVILGGTGAVADLLPGAGAVVGPFIRAGRDISHKVTDSPYQKDIGQIGIDFGKDMTVNLGAWLLSNARKGAKAAQTFKDPEITRAMNLADETKNIKEGMTTVRPASRIPEQRMTDLYRALNVEDPMNDMVLKNLINDMPESYLKKELLPFVSNIKNKPINRQGVIDVLNKYERETVGPWQDVLRKDLAQNRMLPEEARNGSEYLESALGSKPYKDLSKTQKAKYAINRAAELANTGWPGQIMVQEGYTSVGRGKTPNVVETALQKAEKEATIDRLISSYSLLWNKNKEPVEAKNNPLIKAAYDKWKEMQ
jgi:hypothetical protein